MSSRKKIRTGYQDSRKSDNSRDIMLYEGKIRTEYQDSRKSDTTPGTSHCLVGRIRTGYQDNRKSDNSRHITLSEGKIRTAGHLTQLQGHHVV